MVEYSAERKQDRASYKESLRRGLKGLLLGGFVWFWRVGFFRDSFMCVSVQADGEDLQFSSPTTVA